MRSFIPTVSASAALVLALAGVAHAGNQIVTPRLTPPEDGSLSCGVVNASGKKSVDVRIVVYTLAGVSVHDTERTIPPNESKVSVSSYDDARHCVVTVRRGGKKNVRVSLTARDPDGNALASVNGY